MCECNPADPVVKACVWELELLIVIPVVFELIVNNLGFVQTFISFALSSVLVTVLVPSETAKPSVDPLVLFVCVCPGSVIVWLWTPPASVVPVCVQ